MRSIQTQVRFVLCGLLTLLLAGTVSAADNWDSVTPDDDTAADTINVLIPGDPPQRHDVEAIGGVADEDWYRLRAIPGHSYEVRVGARQDDCFDFFSSGLFDVFQSDGTTLITVGDDYPGTGAISTYFATFTAPPGAASSPVFIHLAGFPGCTATSEYTIQVFDTTLLSPRWSTFGGFFTSWGFQNNTDRIITGTLTVITNAGTTVATASVTIPAGQVVFRDTRPTDLNVAAQQAGNVIFSHNGLEGELSADGFMLTVAADVVVPVKFQTPR